MGIYNFFNKSSNNKQLSYFDKTAVLGIETEDTSQRPSDGFLMVTKDSETVLNEKFNLIRYRDLWNLTKISDVLQIIFNTRARKTFREGFDIEPNFERANKGQKKQVEDWMFKCNKNGQTLKEVFQELDKDLNWADDAYLLCLKDYGYNEEGKIVVAGAKEFLRLHPLSVELQLDFSKRLGYFNEGKGTASRKAYFNPQNRVSITTDEIDPKTGKENLQAHYRVSSEQGFLYYNDSEIMHKSAFNPSLTYGYSPLFSLYQKVLVLMLQDSYIKKYYGDDKPTKGLLVFNTSNKKALMKTFDEIRQKTQQNPHGVKPIIAESSDGRKPVEYIDMAKTLNEMQFSDQRDEYRQQVGAMYGVAPLFQNDMSTGGGLNNEGLQITVTNEVIQDRQDLFNNSFIKFIFEENLGLTDWCVTITPDIEQDLMAEEQLKAQEIANAKSKLELGLKGRMTKDGDILFDAGELELEEVQGDGFVPFNLSKSTVQKAEPVPSVVITSTDHGHFHEYIKGNDFTEAAGGDFHVHPVKGAKALQGDTDHEHKILLSGGQDDVAKASEKEVKQESTKLNSKLDEELKSILEDVDPKRMPSEESFLDKIGKVTSKIDKSLRRTASSVFKGIYEKFGKSTSKQVGTKFEMTQKDKDTIDEFKEDPLYKQAFANTSETMSDNIKGVVKESFGKPDFTVDKLVEDIKEQTDIAKSSVRRIARTESFKLSIAAQQNQLEKTGVEYEYTHSGVKDNRTGKDSIELMKLTKDGVSWDEYVKLTEKVAKQFNPKWKVNKQAPMLHPNQRSKPLFRRKK